MAAEDHDTNLIARLMGALPKPSQLSGRLLLLTTAFVMLAEVLIYVPSIAKFRGDWLFDRLEDAQLATLALQTTESREIPEMLEEELLRNAGVLQVAIRRDQRRVLVLSADDMVMAEAMFDLRTANALSLITDAVSTTFAPSGRVIAVRGAPTHGGGELIEIILNEKPLRQAMVTYSTNILYLSLAISVLTGLLVYIALNRSLVRPMKKLSASMTYFGAKPEDASRIISPSSTIVEIREAENQLRTMQTEIRSSLQQKSHLAALGTAVSKINHDLRNMLSTAQLLSERLEQSDDPNVRKMAPRFVKSIDRAVHLATQTLQYGKAEEAVPHKQKVLLRPLVQEVFTEVQSTDYGPIDWQSDFAADFEVYADNDYLFRMLMNLIRNSAQAIEAEEQPQEHHFISVTARRDAADGEPATFIDIRDSGPGIPDAARDTLFEAFGGSLRQGGTGLGLAIAHELAVAQGGALTLVESTDRGTHFQIRLPWQREVS